MPRELIDTLWNVNWGIYETSLMNVPELIDTLWNVNSKSLAARRKQDERINRYIMECKFANS